MILEKFRLDGRVAVVTGASRNIGLSICRAFAEAGAIVVMAARGRETLEAEAANLREATGAQIETVAGDLLTVEGVERLERFVHGKFPQADILVNNAYVFGDTMDLAPLDIPDSEWEATFQGNVLSPYRLCRAFGKPMLQGQGGNIINLLSGAAFQAGGNVSPYGATKSALWLMTRYLCRQLAPKVRVNAICPGIVARPLADMSLIPLGRVGEPEEVAPAALYLASDAASYTTGTVIFVNGGRAW